MSDDYDEVSLPAVALVAIAAIAAGVGIMTATVVWWTIGAAESAVLAVKRVAAR